MIEKKRFYTNAYYSINIDSGVMICQNGVDFSNWIVNPEMFLVLGIDRKDVVFLDQNGKWLKRALDYSAYIAFEALRVEPKYKEGDFFIKYPSVFVMGDSEIMFI